MDFPTSTRHHEEGGDREFSVLKPDWSSSGCQLHAARALSVLIRLNLSAAFNSLNHQILPNICRIHTREAAQPSVQALAFRLSMKEGEVVVELPPTLMDDVPAGY